MGAICGGLLQSVALFDPLTQKVHHFLNLVGLQLSWDVLEVASTAIAHPHEMESCTVIASKGEVGQALGCGAADWAQPVIEGWSVFAAFRQGCPPVTEQLVALGVVKLLGGSIGFRVLCSRRDLGAGARA